MRNRIAENVITLYAVQACTYLLPLITFPYLARTLGPKAWGAVLFAQSIGALVAIVVEYGFDFSATRDTARHESDRSYLRDLIAGVLGAKAALALLCGAILVLVRPFTTSIAASPALYWGSTVWGVAQGINMLWYFQGQQRMRISGTLDVAGKVVATISIFFVVHQPSDGWKVMVAQATGCVVAHGVAVGIAYAEVGFRLPGPRLVWDALSMGWTLFLFRASQSMLTNVNGVILGYLASPTALGLYVGADKIGQASRQCLWPINQALFPHQSQEFQRDHKSALRIVRRSLKVLGGLGVCSGLVLVFTAPLLIRIALGPSFVAAVPTLRILGLLTPLTAVGTVLGFQWMLPLGMDRQFNITFFVCGVVHMLLAAVLTSRFGSAGMAAAVVLSQALIVACFVFFLVRSRIAPPPPVPLPEAELQPVETLV